MVNKPMEVLVLSMADSTVSIQPDVWLTAYPIPFESMTLELQ